MSIVSDSNHWMFISSNGGITAGRKNADHALFPYYTDDKITELAHTTGSKTIFQVPVDGEKLIWEPFSVRYSDRFEITRNLYKNRFGNKVMFEEINHDLGLKFSYQWNSTNLYGFVKKSQLTNLTDQPKELTLLDGIQNIMPYGVSSDLQMRSSNLVDAYKRNELEKESGLGIYALSAIIVDKAEPSEALKANIAWSLGLEDANHLVSSLQLDSFRNLEPLTEETDVKGEKGAYFVTKDLKLAGNSESEWSIIANVNQNQSQVIELSRAINSDDKLLEKVEQDVFRGTNKLLELVAGADGIQLSNDELMDARHYSNTLFNIMRGGTFDHNYRIEKDDFTKYLQNASKKVYQSNEDFLNNLDDHFDKSELDELLDRSEDLDLIRLGKEYLPLKFSRRHGDPSRPWNQFSINTNSEEDGSKILDYEGNWRDIFQNWEALAHSYPGFIESMIFKFLNASTFDGYNPYRVTKGGIDWEVSDPDDPWSYIGYWGDHQIIYLLKFLEFYKSHVKAGLSELFENDQFVYANVPYRIKSYEDIAKDPKDTIEFDEESDLEIRQKVDETGADGALLGSDQEEIHHVNFTEKIFATLLAKVSNFIPEAGIWMNTQRPEWNDANNALVGNGVSMVTLYYLHRFLKFLEPLVEELSQNNIKISEELKIQFEDISDILKGHNDLLSGNISDNQRRVITEGLGKAGSDYRGKIYANGFSGKKSELEVGQISDFITMTLNYLEHSIRANKRDDDLYHAYNLMSFNEDGINISYLDEMLEGQVAVLSANYLTSEQSLSVLDALRKSALYREDQQSYILYPNKDLPGFLEKNNIPKKQVERSELLKKMLADGNKKLINKDIEGGYHFNGNFRNARDLKQALNELKTGPYEELAKQDEDLVLYIFEEVFDHKAFTGRSGTFFGYEGLGSIYWHMVSKLHLAVEEVCEQAVENESDEDIQQKLANHFEEIGEGIGVHKSPEVYGAFPTDPYSHTPQHRGAQQPGMTGQVKEDILVRIGELGLDVKKGVLHFNPTLLKKEEFTESVQTLNLVSLSKEKYKLTVPENALVFTCCQVPIIYQTGESESVEVILSDGSSKTFDQCSLDEETTRHIFQRSGIVKQINVLLNKHKLR
ncbi:hypothetical protein ACKGJO_03255 [Gracilimonas sp. Q87]|uniref:hypothetical protein n=1 Tax=Gracilimonas sp. Q87 TaxID=3384766 RepID=UPI0039843F49